MDGEGGGAGGGSHISAAVASQKGESSRRVTEQAVAEIIVSAAGTVAAHLVRLRGLFMLISSLGYRQDGLISILRMGRWVPRVSEANRVRRAANMARARRF